MTELSKSIRIEGTLFEDEWGDQTAKLMDYRIEGVTKPATYTIVAELPYDFIIQNYAWRITEAFNGTIDVGDSQNNSRYLADADFGDKTVDKKSKAVSRLVASGREIIMYLGAGTTGKIELHITGFLLRPSLL